MSQDNKVQVEFGATTDGVEHGAKVASNVVADAMASMKSSFANMEGSVKQLHDSITGAFGGIQAGFAKFNNAMFAVQNALAGTGAIKAFVNDSMDVTKEALSMGKALGVTATEASYMAQGLSSVGLGTEGMITAGQKINIQLAKNEQAFSNLGVATRDSIGNLKSTAEIMDLTNERLRQFADGADRNVEGIKIYGRSWNEVSTVVARYKGVSEEVRAETDALNRTVGEESVAAMRAYKQSQLDVGDVMTGIQNTIGQALLPRLTEAANWFKEIGPEAVSYTRVAMAGYLSIQDQVTASVGVLWKAVKDAFSAIGKIIADVFGDGSQPMTAMQFFQNVIKVIQIAFIGFRIGIQESVTIISGYLESLANTARMVGTVVAAALAGDWDGVKAAWSDFGAAQKATLKNTMDEAVKIAVKGREDIDAVISADLGAKAKVTAITKKEQPDALHSEKTDPNAGKESHQVQMWDLENKKAKENHQLKNDLKERDLQADVAYWESKLTVANAKNGDLAKVEEKVSAARLAAMKKMSAEERGMSAQETNEKERAGLDAIALKQAESAGELALGKITKAQMYEMDIQFEAQRIAIQRQAQQARIQLAETDPTQNPVALKIQQDKLLELERNYQTKKKQLLTQEQIENQAFTKSFETGMASSFTGILKTFATGTMSIKTMFAEMGKAVLSAFVDIFAQIAAKWLASQLMQQVGSKVTALGQILANASVAGSAAFASIAAIPIVGPAMAPAAAAAAYAGAVSFAGGIASASAGFDIPAGVNPITQLHEREMVLPQAQADAVRNMADGGSGGGDVHMHVHTQSTQDFQNFLSQNSHVLAPALRRLGRNFSPTRA